MDYVEAIRLQALKVVMSPDYDYEIRKILRWYSREFSTPLQDVYDIPIDEVLRDYFECTYGELTEGQLEYELETLLQTEEERKAAKLEEDAGDIDDEAFLTKAKEAIVNEESSFQKLTDKIDETTKALEELPEFSVDFSEDKPDDNLEDMLELDSLQPIPKKKR